MIETPRLLLDRQRLTRNAARLRERCGALGVAFRPHIKTAKSAEVARVAHDAAAGPLTVSTLREAEAMAAAGFRDLLLAATMIPARLPRAAALQRAHGARLLVVADDPGMVAMLDRAAEDEFGVLIEIDCGEHRSGLAPDSRALADVAAAIAASRHFTPAGVMTHAGHSYATDDRAALADLAETERAAATQAASVLRGAGYDCGVVSIGSSPTLLFARHLEGVTEVRAGVALFQDLAQFSRGMCGWDDLALSVLATVIGHQRNGPTPAIVLDAGALAMSKDNSANTFLPEAHFGILADARTGARLPLAIDVLHQEHGTVYLPDPSWFARLPVGSLVRVMPNHACLTAAGGYGGYDVHDGDGVAVARWPRVDGW